MPRCKTKTSPEAGIKWLPYPKADENGFGNGKFCYFLSCPDSELPIRNCIHEKKLEPAKVLQDAKKLVEKKKRIEGFIGHTKMLTFVRESPPKGSAPDIRGMLKKKLAKGQENILTFGEDR